MLDIVQFNIFGSTAITRVDESEQDVTKHERYKL